MLYSLRILVASLFALTIVGCADYVDGPFHDRDDDNEHHDSTDNDKDTTHTGSGNDTTKTDSSVYFSRDVLPLLVSNCAMAKCHDEASHKDGVVLTTYAYVMRNITPGNLSRSELYDAITETNPEDVMPPPPRKLT